DALLQAIWTAFPDRLVRRREPGSPRGMMTGGKGVMLGPESAVRESELFVALDVDAAQGEARVRSASTVDRAWIPVDQLRTTVDVVFEDEAERVSARRRVRYDDLILEESPAPVPQGEHTAAALAEAAVKRWSRVYPPDNPEVESYVTRVRCL